MIRNSHGCQEAAGLPLKRSMKSLKRRIVALRRF
jgi:hypothetical protein